MKTILQYFEAMMVTIFILLGNIFEFVTFDLTFGQF